MLASMNVTMQGSENPLKGNFVRCAIICKSWHLKELRYLPRKRFAQFTISRALYPLTVYKIVRR